MPKLEWVFVELYNHSAGPGASSPRGEAELGALHDRYLSDRSLKNSGDGGSEVSWAASGSSHCPCFYVLGEAQ